jgi:mono/diheme cytochrome c family protein
MKHRLTGPALVLLLLSFLALAFAGPGRNALKIRLRKPKGTFAPGDEVTVRAQIRNKAKESRNLDLELFRRGDPSPLASESLEVGPRSRTWTELTFLVPQDHVGKKLFLVARAGDAEGSRALRMRRPAPVRDGDDDEDDGGRGDGDDDGDDDDDGGPSPADEEWARGRALYLASCAGCHGETGRELRGEDLGDWLEALREGEDDMPAFPGFDRDDVIAMRAYVADPDREVDPTDPPPTDPPPTDPPPTDPPPTDPPPSAPTWESDVAGIMSASCNACHNAGYAAAGVRTDTYAEAFAGRAAIVDSVEQGRMPPGPDLPAATQSTLRAWLDAGAPER